MCCVVLTVLLACCLGTPAPLPACVCRHVAALYGMLAAHPDADIFRGLDPGQWREVRRALIAAVLHTDMVHHFAMVSKVSQGVSQWMS